MKPQLANDAVISDVNYPVIFQVKIDGVRALNMTGTLTGRSLDPFKGFGITEFWSKPEFVGLDGEMILGDEANSKDRLCSLTTGAMSKFKGVTETPNLYWYVFDYLTPETMKLPYVGRYNLLIRRVEQLNHPRIRIVPSVVINNRAELDAALAEAFEQGYEGGILRNPHALPKPGRPSKKKQELMRFKPWGDSEILVTGITEGNTNENEATTNSLGNTERSSSQDGMVPNGRVGSIQGTMLEDFVCPHTKKTLFKKGLEVTVSKGEMSNQEAKFYFENPHEIVGKVVKWAHMTHGVKDLPRFPVFKSLRLLEDIS